MCTARPHPVSDLRFHTTFLCYTRSSGVLEMSSSLHRIIIIYHTNVCHCHSLHRYRLNTLAWPTLHLHLTAATLKQRHYKTSGSPVILIMLPSNPLSSTDRSQCGVCASHVGARGTVEQGVVPNAIIPVLHGRSPEVERCWTQHTWRQATGVDGQLEGMVWTM